MPHSSRAQLSEELIVRLQTTVGNRAVQRLIALQRPDERQQAATTAATIAPAAVAPARTHRWLTFAICLVAIAACAIVWLWTRAS